MSLTKSGRRKRESQSDRDFGQKKRVCLDKFLTEAIPVKIILEKLQNQIDKLEHEDITIEKLTTITKHIKQLRERDSMKEIKVSDVMKVIKILTNYIKAGFIKDFQSNYEWDLIKWKSNVEITFEACLICLTLLSSDYALEKENIDSHLNDIIFFLRKVFDDVNTQLTRVKDVKKISSVTLKELLLENLSVVKELIKIRNFNSLNVTGLITSFIHTVLYHTDSEVQTSALLSIVSFYKKGEEFRALILNLILKSVERVHEHYKFKRNYSINGTLSVSLFTVLIMSLVENVPVLGFHPAESCDAANLLWESYENIMKVICFVITTFIQRIGANSTGHKMYNMFFSNLIGELIQVSNVPEWPSARLILNLLLKPLTDVLMLKPPAEIPLRILAVKALSEIIKQKIIDKRSSEVTMETLNQKFGNVHDECDFTEFAQRLLLHRIIKLKRTELNANNTQIHAAQWFDNVKYKPNFKEKIANLRKLFANSNWPGTAEITEEETRAVLYYLDTTRRNHVDYNVILKYVLCCYYDKTKKVKYTAMQYILEFINADSDLLSQSMISNIVHENLLFSTPSLKERLLSLIDKHLSVHPEKFTEYAPILLRVLDNQPDGVQKTCMDLVMKLLKSELTLQYRTQLCYKILTLIQSDDPALQKQVVDFCSELWLNGDENNLNILLEVVDMPNVPKFLRLFFEEILKPLPAALTENTPSQPPKQTTEAFRKLIRLILERVKRNENTLNCLRLISVLVAVHPNSFVPDLFVIASPLIRPEYTKDYSVEILAAEVLICILPEVGNPDVLNYILLRSELVDKIMSDEGLNYSMGLIVSLLKLVNKLSKFDMIFIYENCFEPSAKILQEYMAEKNTTDNRIISRALCIGIYLHAYFAGVKLNFQPVMDFFIEHKIFGLTTIHCLCYLSIDYKSIMGNETVRRTISKYLKCHHYPVLLKAVLYNILCSLKNITGGQWTRIGDSIEPVKNLIQTHIRDILDCIIDQRSEIRQVAYGVVRHLLTSGLIPESRLIPSALLMSTDPEDNLSRIAVDILQHMERKKLTEFMKNAAKCIIASMVFNLKCLKEDFIRGCVVRKNRPEARCNYFYVIYQEDVMMRRQIIDSVLRAISPEAATTAFEKFYLADNLAFFTYKYQEELYYVLWQIEGVLAAAPIPQVPNDPNHNQTYINKYYGLYFLTHVKSSLMCHYGFNGDKLRKYYQDDGKRDLVQTKKHFLLDIPQNSFPNSKNTQLLCHNIFNAVKKQQKRNFQL